MPNLNIRITDVEKNAYKRAADEMGVSLTDWARARLSGAPAAGKKPARGAVVLEGHDEVVAGPDLGAPEAPKFEDGDRIDLSKRGLSSRKAAIEVGRLLGEDQGRREGLRGTQRDQQIARAKRYAAWEFDGKPVGTEHARRYDKEFPGSAVSEAVSGPTLRALA